MNPAIPDPIAQPVETLSLLEKLYHSGAFFCLGIVATFYVVTWLFGHVAWFQADPKRRAYIAALLGGLALLVGPASQGTTPSVMMLITAGTTALGLIIDPTKLAKKLAGGGGAMVLVFAIAASGAACKSAIVKQVETTATTAAADAWDCTKQEYQALTAGKSWLQLGIAVALKFAELVAKDGADPIAIAEDLARTYGAPIVACTMAELRGGVAASPAAGSGAGSSMTVSAPRASPSARAAAAVIAAKKWSYR